MLKTAVIGEEGLCVSFCCGAGVFFGERERERERERGRKSMKQYSPTGFSSMIASALVFAAADMAGETLEEENKRRRNEMMGDETDNFRAKGNFRCVLRY